MRFFKNLKQKYPSIYSITVFIGVLMAWRGIWGLLDRYFFPDNSMLSYVLGIIIGLGILYLNDFKLKELE